MKLKRHSGFTLMELIGVMAIMAILAGVMAPNIADSINRANSDAEELNLNSLADSLQHYILDQKRIPNANTASWVKAISSSSMFSSEDIQYNTKGYERRLIFDPRFFTTSNSSFNGFVQNKGLSAAPVSARMMLVSSLTRDIPAVPNNATTFNAIWDQTSSATVVEDPNLKIKRINLAAKFHRVILSNQSTNKPYYQLETGSKVAIPASISGTDGQLTRYVLDSTRIALYATPYPTGSLNQVGIISSDWSRRYQSNGISWSWVKQ